MRIQNISANNFNNKYSNQNQPNFTSILKINDKIIGKDLLMKQNEPILKQIINNLIIGSNIGPDNACFGRISRDTKFCVERIIRQDANYNNQEVIEIFPKNREIGIQTEGTEPIFISLENGKSEIATELQEAYEELVFPFVN